MTGGVRVLDSAGNSVGTTGDNLKATLPITVSQAGYAGLLGMNDPAGNVRIPIAGSSQGLLGVAEVNVDFEEAFATTTISTTKWRTLAATMTASISSNVATLNVSNTLTSGTHIALQSHRSVEFARGADRVIGWRARITGVVTGVVVELGALVAAAGTAAPTGGAFFRLNAAGELRGVAVTVAGGEIQTAPITMPDVASFHDWVVVVTNTGVYFQIDNVIVGSLAADAVAPSPVVAEWGYLGARIYNSAVVAQAVQLQVARCVTAYFGGSYQYRGEILAALSGDVGSQGIPGTGSGYLANWANNVAPTSATLSNTSAGYAAVGGQFQFAAVGGGESDFALFGFLVPANTATNKSSTLLVHGVTIDTFVTGAAVATSTILQWGLGYGAGQVSLATLDSTTTKAARRVPIGIQSLEAGAAIGKLANTVRLTFTQPLPVNPGEYLHVILKVAQGAATASLVFRGTVGIDATWV